MLETFYFHEISVGTQGRVSLTMINKTGNIEKICCALSTDLELRFQADSIMTFSLQADP